MEELALVIGSFSRLWIGALIPLFLGCYYVFVTDASLNSKLVVAVLLLVSLAVLFALPSYWLWVLLLQVAVGLYVGFFLAWKRW